MDNNNSNKICKSIIIDIISEIIQYIPNFKNKNHFFSHSSKIEESANDKQHTIKYHSNRILIKDIVDIDNNSNKIIYKNKIHVNNNNKEGEEEEIIYIWQPMVLKQRKNDSCGYYCLFNSLSILNSCFISEKQESVSLYGNLENRVLFWHFYWVICKLFLEKANKKKSRLYPWTEKCVLKGVLERSYVDYLFQRDNMISRQHYPITVLPDWAIQSLKNNRLPIDEIREMERISQIFKSNSNYTHVFIIGQAVHWITIVINKVDNHSELMVVDSRNHDLLGATDEELMALVNKHPELSEHMRKSYLFSLVEPKLIVEILKDCMLGDGDLTKTLLQLNLSCFLENFYSHVTNQTIGSGSGENNAESEDLQSILNHLSINHHITTTASATTTTTTTTTTNNNTTTTTTTTSIQQQQQLIYWLENYWPPSVIEYNICQVLDSIITTKEDMDKYLECHILESLSVWIKSTSDHLKNHPDVKLIQRFSQTMSWFNKKFLTM